MEVFHFFWCVLHVGRRFPCPFMAFRVSAPFDEVPEFSTNDLGILDVVNFVLFLVVHYFWWGRRRLSLRVVAGWFVRSEE